VRVFATMKRLRLERRMCSHPDAEAGTSPFRAGWEGGWYNGDAIAASRHPSASLRLCARQTDDYGGTRRLAFRCGSLCPPWLCGEFSLPGVTHGR